MADGIVQAEAYWDSVAEVRARMAPRTRWNESAQILRHVNRLICGRPVEGETFGLMELLKDRAAVQLDRGISVGCGSGIKELMFLRCGIVKHFDLFDLSAENVKNGEAYAKEWGVSSLCSFTHADAFASVEATAYDLVYWDSSLHHMVDADAAVRWSRDVLRPGGWFLMNEYVGATRWQHTDGKVTFANLIRRALPASYFINPVDAAALYPRKTRRLSLAEMAFDPSEAADSEAIIPAVLRYFPQADVRQIGGTVFDFALNDVLAHIREDGMLLRCLLRLDSVTRRIPHLAVAIAQKAGA